MIELGLQRISRLLSSTRLPWRAIHVAGTNGKGSVCAAVSNILTAYNRSGWRSANSKPEIRHGRFTSPHLVERWDCISIDDQTISASIFHDVENDVHRRNCEQGIHASEFELLTATAFEAFTRARVDVAVIEVGMGGRLDATNILGQRDLPAPHGCTMDDFRASPLVTAVTKIGMDHEAFLGSTIEAIARQKAGIFKPDVPFVADETNPDHVNAVLAQVAAETRAPPAPQLLLIADISLAAAREPPTEQDVGAQNPFSHSTAAQRPLHVRANAALAFNATWAALDRLHGLGSSPGPSPLTFPADPPPDSIHALAKTLAHEALTARIPGRQQLISLRGLTGRRAPVLLDGAHNPQSAAALAQALSRGQGSSSEDAAHDRPTTWVVGMSAGRDPRALLEPLLRRDDRVVVVQFGPVAGMPWVQAMPCAELRSTVVDVVVGKGGRGEVVECGTDVRRALEMASGWAGKDAPIVIAGSLYLVGDVLRLVEGADHAG